MTWRRGTVLWFDGEKGFGFIEPDNGGARVFVEYPSIDAPGFKTLTAGQAVAFTAEPRPRGAEATAVRPLAPQTSAYPKVVRPPDSR